MSSSCYGISVSLSSSSDAMRCSARRNQQKRRSSDDPCFVHRMRCVVAVSHTLIFVMLLLLPMSSAEENITIDDDATMMMTDDGMDTWQSDLIVIYAILSIGMALMVSMMGIYLFYLTLFEHLLIRRYHTEGMIVPGNILATTNTTTTKVPGHHDDDNGNDNDNDKALRVLVEYKYVEQCLGGYTLTVRKEIMAKPSDFYRGNEPDSSPPSHRRGDDVVADEAEQENTQHHQIQIIFQFDEDDDRLAGGFHRHDVGSDDHDDEDMSTAAAESPSPPSSTMMKLDVFVLPDHPHSGLSRSSVIPSSSCYRCCMDRRWWTTSKILSFFYGLSCLCLHWGQRNVTSILQQQQQHQQQLERDDFSDNDDDDIVTKSLLSWWDTILPSWMMILLINLIIWMISAIIVYVWGKHGISKALHYEYLTSSGEMLMKSDDETIATETSFSTSHTSMEYKGDII